MEIPKSSIDHKWQIEGEKTFSWTMKSKSKNSRMSSYIQSITLTVKSGKPTKGNHDFFCLRCHIHFNFKEKLKKVLDFSKIFTNLSSVAMFSLRKLNFTLIPLSFLWQCKVFLRKH